MQITDNQTLIELQAEFELLWCGKIQALSSLRKTKMTQSQMAAMTGRSLKTIQRFENYKSKDAELMYLYKNILS
jgi:DNA-binding XRE family transcriptional regulator